MLDYDGMHIHGTGFTGAHPVWFMVETSEFGG